MRNEIKAWAEDTRKDIRRFYDDHPWLSFIVLHMACAYIGMHVGFLVRKVRKK